jgi:hypothetical protein
VQIDPHDDIVVWDYCGTLAGGFTRYPMVRVGDRNEPNPAKRLPYDPYGRPQERHMSSFTRRLLFYLVIAIAAGILWYLYELRQSLRHTPF